MLYIALTWSLVKFNFKIIEYEYEANTITKFKSRFSEFISKLNKRKQILLCYFFQENCYENFLLITVGTFRSPFEAQLTTENTILSCFPQHFARLLTFDYLSSFERWGRCGLGAVHSSVNWNFSISLHIMEEEFDDLEIWSARKLLMQKLISIKQNECTLSLLSPSSNCKMHLPHFWNVST